jgi:murein DD-endopeptidase MepM/ murein hydrolase activator NlpD
MTPRARGPGKRSGMRIAPFVTVIKGALLLPILICALAVGAHAGARSSRPLPGPVVLAPARAVGLQVDTHFVGGYARGRYSEALRGLGSGLAPEERELVGQHLDKIFAGVNDAGGLGRAGRLRLVYERAVRPDGTTRSLRVLTAEAAAAGAVHTAYYYETDGRPGYFDAYGRSLEAEAWTGPVPRSRLTSPFGSRRMHPILHRLLPHLGVDFAAPAGTPVRVSADGVVVAAEPRGGYGNMVEVRHPNGFTTRYAHLSGFRAGLVRGAWLRQGEVIGYVGATGLATGPHLHYEVRRDGRPVDPMRVSGNPSAPAPLAADPHWFEQRQRLGHLLSRVPTVGRGE